MPLLLFSGSGAKAERRRKVKETPTAKHAPPEPFVIGGGTEANTFRTNLTVGIASTMVSTLSMFGSDQSNGPDKIAATNEEKTEPLTEATNTNTNANTESSVEESIPEETTETTVETEVAPPLVLPAGVTDFDFDGDGKSDIGRWHAGSTQFKVRFTDDGTTASSTIGSSGAKPAPGDFDNDDKFDMVVFNAGTWSGKKSSDGSAINVSFGQYGDKPMPGDYS